MMNEERIIRPRRSRSAAAYSRQTFPWMICRSVGPYVRTCVGQSLGRLFSALWKNCGSDPNAVWHHRSDGSRDEASSGVWDRSTGRGTFGGEFGARHCPKGPIGRTCATAPRRGPLPKLLWANLLQGVEENRVITDN